MIFTVFILFSVYGVSHQQDWSYDSESTWQGVCTTGQRQSPINILTQDTVLNKQSRLVFQGYSNVRVSASNNGHQIRWDIADPSTAPVLMGGPLEGNYTFAEFHLHWIAEHAFNGIKYPLEIHIVHVKTGLTLDEAKELPDGLAVIGIMGQIAEKPGSSYAFDQLTPMIQEIYDPEDGPVQPMNIDLSRLLSPEPQSYYTYNGSLTTPTCEEAVVWIVNDKPVLVTGKQYRLMVQADVGDLENDRSFQALNDRVVYRSKSRFSNYFPKRPSTGPRDSQRRDESPKPNRLYQGLE